MRHSILPLLALSSLVFSIDGFSAEGGHDHHGTSPTKTPTDEKFSESIKGLKAVNAAKVVELKNGETYKITATAVKQKIGNRWVRRLAYNGSIPGPIIKAPQGSKIKVIFLNKTEIETTLHSHGLRLDSKFDGTPGLSQKPIKPGESFTYEIKFPDAGVYWYHPHIREDYTQDLGLYGNYLVTPKSDAFYSKVNKEVPLVLDDVLLTDKAQPFFKDYANFSLMGRYGNVMLVNGIPDFQTEVKSGEVVRFFVTNVANTRTFNFAIPGAKMKLVGSDGGKYERETWTESVLLSPSERAIVEVLFEKPGEFSLENRTPNKTYSLGKIKVSKEVVKATFHQEFKTLRENQDMLKEFAEVRRSFDKPVAKKLKLSILMGANGKDPHAGHNMGASSDAKDPHAGHNMGGNAQHNAPAKIEWEDEMFEMNAASTSREVIWKLIDEESQKENMDINWNFKKGELVKISIFNDPKSAHPMQHPIHFHGQRVAILTVNGKKNENLVWKDSVLVQTGDTVEVVLEASNPGKWMIHCHIAEHLSSGMMMGFEVN